jgi:hypothetical protein
MAPSPPFPRFVVMMPLSLRRNPIDAPTNVERFWGNAFEATPIEKPK